MGVDAKGYFTTKRVLTDAELDILNQEFQRTHCDLSAYKFKRLTRSRYDEELPAEAIEIDFDMDRFYGIGYARGPILRHATVLGWLKYRNCVTKVFYGGDCSEMVDFEEWTDDLETRTLAHFFALGELTYRDRGNLPLASDGFCDSGNDGAAYGPDQAPNAHRLGIAGVPTNAKSES